MTLTEFLLARIAEDEAVAREATAGPWRWEEPSTDEWPLCDKSLVSDGDLYPFGASKPVLEGLGYDASSIEGRDEDRAHIARHHPARVLAECEAKRRIVEACGPARCGDADEPEGWRERFEEGAGFAPHYHFPDGYAPGCDGCSAAEATTRDGERVLQLLALPYSDHPDYDETWRP